MSRSLPEMVQYTKASEKKRKCKTNDTLVSVMGFIKECELIELASGNLVRLRGWVGDLADRMRDPAAPHAAMELRGDEAMAWFTPSNPEPERIGLQVSTRDC